MSDILYTKDSVTGNFVPLSSISGAALVTTTGGTLTSVADKTPLNSGVVLLLSAAGTRKTILVRSNKANINKMRIGDVNITATQGIELNPGDTVTLETTAAVYAKNLGNVTTSVLQKLSIVEIS
jgi:hypothetical protein